MGYSFIPFSMSPFPPTCRQKEPDMQRERAGTHGGLISVDRRAGLVKSQPRLLCLAFALVRYSIFALVPRQKRDLSLMHYIQYSHLTLESALPSLRKYSQPRSVRHKQPGAALPEVGTYKRKQDRKKTRFRPRNWSRKTITV